MGVVLGSQPVQEEVGRDRGARVVNGGGVLARHSVSEVDPPGCHHVSGDGYVPGTELDLEALFVEGRIGNQQPQVDVDVADLCSSEAHLELVQNSASAPDLG